MKKLKIRNKKLKLVIILLGIAIILPLTITFSRYVYNFVKNYIIKSNNFFFNSDKLTKNNELYRVNNWSGVSNFTIQFDLNNHKNNILTSDTDIAYQLSANCSQDVICNLSATSGTIYVDEKTDNIVLTVIPTRVFDTDEEVEVNVTASSISPYEETLSAHFIIKVGKKGISYEITDSVGNTYLNFIITNAADEYKAIRPTGSYNVGDIILTDVYRNLTPEEQENFASAMITLSFDPNVVILDTTSDIMASATFQHTMINGVNYISSLTFKVDSQSSTEVRFYKKNVSQNYTYPFVNQNSVITFTAQI